MFFRRLPVADKYVSAMFFPKVPKSWSSTNIFGQSTHVCAMIDTVLDPRCLFNQQIVIGRGGGRWDFPFYDGNPKHGLHLGNGGDCTWGFTIGGKREQIAFSSNSPTPGLTKPMKATVSSPFLYTLRTSASLAVAYFSVTSKKSNF